MATVRSRILLSERVPNRARRFGAEPDYFPAIVQLHGREPGSPALFTRSQIVTATERAKSQPEDAPALVGYWRRVWHAAACLWHEVWSF